MSDGTRKVINISEVTGMEGEVVAMQDIVTFAQEGISPEGKAVGQFKFTGVRPRFLDKLKMKGLLRDLNMRMFEGVV